MIWITTLCLLLVAAWFLFNGLNERNWVKAHGHETGDDGEGLLYKLAPGRDEEDLVYKLSTKPDMIERLAADTPVDTSGTGDAFLDRVAARVRQTNERFEDRVARKVKEVTANPDQQPSTVSPAESAGQTDASMQKNSENVRQSLAAKAKSMAADYRNSVRSAGADGDQDLMTRLSEKVKSSANAIAPGNKKDNS